MLYAPVMVLSACPCSLGLPTPSGLALGMRTQIAAGHPHLDLLLHSQYPIILLTSKCPIRPMVSPWHDIDYPYVSRGWLWASQHSYFIKTTLSQSGPWSRKGAQTPSSRGIVSNGAIGSTSQGRPVQDNTADGPIIKRLLKPCDERTHLVNALPVIQGFNTSILK